MMGEPETEQEEVAAVVEEAMATFAPLPPIEESAGAEQVSEPAVSPPEPPTAARPETADGFVMDEWGLPLIGPVRAAVLARVGRPDPNIDPTGWERIDTPAAPKE